MISMSVYKAVSARISRKQHNMACLIQIFCCLRLCHSPSLEALQYVVWMTSPSGGMLLPQQHRPQANTSLQCCMHNIGQCSNVSRMSVVRDSI